MRKKTVLWIIFACVIGLCAAIFIFRGNIFADELNQTEIFKSNYGLDLDRNGKSETVDLKINNAGPDTITIFESLFRKTSAELPGFEDNIRVCKEPVHNFGGSNYICLIGEVGAHSQNIVFVGYGGNKISFVPFRSDSGETKNMVSDVPGFQVSDSEGKFSTDNRNYDLDPVINAIRSSYTFANGVFTFSGSEDIIYDEAS